MACCHGVVGLTLCTVTKKEGRDGGWIRGQGKQEQEWSVTMKMGNEEKEE